MAFAGANYDPYLQLEASGLHPTGVRRYLNEVLDSTGQANPSPIPPVPPAAPTNPWLPRENTTRACLSIRPPLWELINPQTYPNLKTDLDNFLKAAPPGAPSLLGLWHEASGDNGDVDAGATDVDNNCGPSKDKVCRGPGGIYSVYFDQLDTQFHGLGGASGLLKQAQSFVQQRALSLGANVLVGAIEVVSTSDQLALADKLDPWMGNNLDFYTCDVYDNSTCTAVPADLLDAFQAVVVNGHMPNELYPTIGITETNSRCPDRRPFWFNAAWSWLKSHSHTSDRVCFLTYWNANGTQSGPWLDAAHGGEPTIDALAAIFAESSP